MKYLAALRQPGGPLLFAFACDAAIGEAQGDKGLLVREGQVGFTRHHLKLAGLMLLTKAKKDVGASLPPTPDDLTRLKADGGYQAALRAYLLADLLVDESTARSIQTETEKLVLDELGGLATTLPKSYKAPISPAQHFLDERRIESERGWNQWVETREDFSHQFRY